MKNKFALSLLVILLLSATLLLSGCGLFYHPGKTAAEVNREHIQMLRINQQELMRDIDRTGHFDQPSRLSEMRMP
jgi:hypothetical protein